MYKRLLFLFFIIIFYNVSGQESVWNKVSTDKIAHLPTLERGSYVARYDTYSLDYPKLVAQLQFAPNREDNTLSTLIIDFPNGYGQLESYRIYKAPVLHPELGAKYPEINSYLGISLKDKTATIRFSTTVFGFHGMIQSARTSTSYIDPYTTDLNYYMVYLKKDTYTDKNFECGTATPEGETSSGTQFRGYRNTTEAMMNGNLRKYRLAMACTMQYAAFHISAAGLENGTLQQKIAAVLSAMNVTVTRVNSVYERDLSVTLEIIPTNENIIHITTSGGLTNTNSSTLLSQIQAVVDAGVGFNSYDIGHVVSTGAGGIARLQSPCSANKARGVTGLSSPVGDPFDIDYVAHEMGHQFGANHTQNNSCQRNTDTAMEPGSGSTIMGYAGICAPNVQNHSDAYFHAVSLSEIKNFILGAGSCAQLIPNGNTAPEIGLLFTRTIPKGTAFYLEGAASDAQGDELTYTWEQYNSQVANQPPVSTSTLGPTYRSLSPSVNPRRYFPNFSSVLQNNLSPTWEVTPTVGRSLNFALTVRDNNPLGGAYTTSFVTVNVSNISGPFRVTSQTTSESWQPGSQQTITWDVAGTNSLPVDTQFVDILLSTNGGLSFDYVLASNTPNDGSHSIEVPDVVTTNARILIQAVGNIYYAVNSTPFTIGDCHIYNQTVSASIPDGIGANQAGAALISTFEVTDTFSIESLKVSTSITHPYIGDLTITLEHPNGTQIPLFNRQCNNSRYGNLNIVFQDGSQTMSCASPTNGTFSPAGALSQLYNTNAQGVWKLIIQDYYNEDAGILNAWGLDFGCQEGDATVSSIENINFAIYPNPSQGQFTLKFGQDSKAKTITIFDTNGRMVYQKDHRAEATEIPLQLDHLQSGVYLIRVQSAQQIQTQKLIIK